MTQIEMKQLVTKIVQAVLYVLGSGIIAYNITAFKISKHGSYYFMDKNQLWLAIGVALVSAGLIVRNWKKL